MISVGPRVRAADLLTTASSVRGIWRLPASPLRCGCGGAGGCEWLRTPRATFRRDRILLVRTASRCGTRRSVAGQATRRSVTSAWTRRGPRPAPTGRRRARALPSDHRAGAPHRAAPGRAPGPAPGLSTRGWSERHAGREGRTRVESTKAEPGYLERGRSARRGTEKKNPTTRARPGADRDSPDATAQRAISRVTPEAVCGRRSPPRLTPTSLIPNRVSLAPLRRGRRRARRSRRPARSPTRSPAPSDLRPAPFATPSPPRA